MWIPLASSEDLRSSPQTVFLAFERLITLPAPWQDEPNERFIESSVPTNTQEPVPMLPGTSTGCPILRYSSGRPSKPGPKARVAPLRCTQTFSRCPLDLVSLDLAHIVSDIIDLVQVPVVHLAGQGLFESAPGVVRQHLAVGEGVVGRAAHGCQVVLSFGRIQRRADQLAVGQLDVVAPHSPLEIAHVIRADLVPEATRAAVDLQDQVALHQSHRIGGLGIEDLLDDIDFDEVIAGAQRADLGAAALLGFLAHLSRVSSIQAAVLFGPPEVCLGGVALLTLPSGCPGGRPGPAR